MTLDYPTPEVPQQRYFKKVSFLIRDIPLFSLEIEEVTVEHFNLIHEYMESLTNMDIFINGVYCGVLTEYKDYFLQETINTVSEVKFVYEEYSIVISTIE